MNSIQLTEEHKSKILEMCKVLFPEYNKKIIYDGGKGCRPEHKIKITGTTIYFPYIEDGDKEPLKYNVQFKDIHWFEFCMTNLVASLVKKDNLSNRIWREVWDKLNGGPMVGIKEHPIDYLYNEYKKLK